jgi:hypothetical protein
MEQHQVFTITQGITFSLAKNYLPAGNTIALLQT